MLFAQDEKSVEDQAFVALETRIPAISQSFDHTEEARERSQTPVVQAARGKPFARSYRARSYLPAHIEKSVVEAIDSESEDEDVKPIIRSQFNAFSSAKRSTEVNMMGSSRWYSGVYAEKKRLEEELEEEKRLEAEAARAGVEELSEIDSGLSESESEKESVSDGSEMDDEERIVKEEKPKEVFILSDDDEVFSDEDLPMENPVQREEMGVEEPVEKEPVEKEPVEKEPVEKEPVEVPVEELPKESTEKEVEEPVEEPAEEPVEKEPAEESMEKQSEEQSEKQPEVDQDEFIDDFAEEDLPSEPKKEVTKETPDEDMEDIPKETPSEPKEKAKSKKKSVGKKDKKKGKKDKKEPVGVLGELEPPKPKKKKKSVAKK